MPTAVVALPTPEALVAHIRKVLCERDSLAVEQTPLFRTPLVKAGKPCGYVFHIEGPRRLKTSALWTATADKIIFYDSTGTRFHEARLSESPAIGDLGTRNSELKTFARAA